MPVTATIVALAFLVGIAAAVRSTWSPCGRSMLSSITPVAERGRGHRYPTTATWFVLGSTAGGATLGVLAGLVAAGVQQLSIPGRAVAVVALAGTALIAVSDSGVVGPLLPVHHRQVNELWLDQFRPWVYGAGFGWQIGTGVATYVRTGAVYLMILLAALSGRPVAALGACTAFGIVRGLAVLLGRRITTPAGLQSFHRRFAELEPRFARATVAVELIVAAALAAAAWRAAWPLAATILLVVLGCAALVFAVGVPPLASRGSSLPSRRE